MPAERFRKLADELAGAHPELPGRLVEVRRAAEALRARADAAVGAFVAGARELGAEHLCQLRVSPVRPDEKHVDCLQFGIERGRWELLCVAIASGAGKVRLVGPFKRGGPEGPCQDAPLAGPQVEAALDERIERLIREASA